MRAHSSSSPFSFCCVCLSVCLSMFVCAQGWGTCTIVCKCLSPVLGFFPLQVMSNLGGSDIDSRLEEQLIDGILYAFQEQTSEVLLLNYHFSCYFCCFSFEFSLYNVNQPSLSCRILWCWMDLELSWMRWESVSNLTYHRSVVPFFGDWTTKLPKFDSRLPIWYLALLVLCRSAARYACSLLCIMFRYFSFACNCNVFMTRCIEILAHARRKWLILFLCWVIVLH